MRKLNLMIDQYYALSAQQKEKISLPSVTLDGYIITESTVTYDNDFDQTFPIILEGVRNPNQEDRKNSKLFRKSFPKSLLPLRKLKWEDWWDEGKVNLSEIMSAYPYLSVGLKVGNRSAFQLTSTFIYIVYSVDGNPNKIPFYEDFLQLCERRCRSNNYQGKWSKLAKLLQVSSNPAALFGLIDEMFTNRELFGNYIPKGKEYIGSMFIEISIYPVNKPKRKRGYSDKGSQKALHEIHDLSTSCSTREMTRDKLLMNSKNSLIHFLYGVTNPTWKGEEPESEKEFHKNINKQLNQLKRSERKRINSETGPVIQYRLSEEELRKIKDK